MPHWKTLTAEPMQMMGDPRIGPLVHQTRIVNEVKRFTRVVYDLETTRHYRVGIRNPRKR